MRVLLIKELRQGWRSFRIPAFFLVLLFFALLDPLTMKYMGEIMEWVGGDIQVIFPEPTSTQAFSQFMTSASQLGFFALVLISMGLVSNEKNSGVASWILTQPISRRDYLLAKLSVISLTIMGGMLGAGLVAYLYSWSLLGSLPFLPAFLSMLGLSVYGIFLLSITILGSILFKSAWGAGILTFVVMAGNSVIHMLSSRLEFIYYLPYGYVSSAHEAFTGIDGGLFLGRLVVTLVLVGVLFMFSNRQFSRQELG